MAKMSRTRLRAFAALAGLAALTAIPVSAQRSEADMRAMLARWPQSARDAAMAMMERYGPPQEVTASTITWRNNGPWRYTTISNYETPHSFPGPHPDVMEQGIDYAVPAAMFDDLALYDGSVTADRTQGILAARCDKEGANMLALNLAHDIVTRRRNVANARAYYARAISTYMQTGRTDPYMQQLRFTPRPNSGDRDRPARPPRG